MLSGSGILRTTRGNKGGCMLAKPARDLMVT
ncbi:MAG TPA: hypothetical protein RWO09_07295 [Ruminococcus sp.]